MLLPFQIKINLLVIKFAFELNSKTPTVRSDAEAELRWEGNIKWLHGTASHESQEVQEVQESFY